MHPPMPESPPPSEAEPEAIIPGIRIAQVNIRHTQAATHDFLAHFTYQKYDILAIQEPYIDAYHNTRATSHWTVIYPYQTT